MSEKNYESVDLSTRGDRLLKNVCRSGVTLLLAVTTTVGMQKSVEYAGKTLDGIKTETTRGIDEAGHKAVFTKLKADEPVETLGNFLKTVGGLVVTTTAGLGLIPKKRRNKMTEDSAALWAAAQQRYFRED